jgi:hypothetical protein
MQNFGKIKNAFNELLAEGLSTDNTESKELFKNYIKSIRENEIMKTQFLVISNIENKIESNREKAIQFVKENIELFSKFKTKTILEANDNLSQFISLCEKGHLLNEDVIYKHKDLHENITKLIFTKKTPNNINTIVEATAAVVDYIINNKEIVISEAIELPNSMLSTIMVEKYNERYSTLDENEKEILKVLIESTDEQKQEVYKKTLKECIDLINENLKEADLNAKDKLLQVKEKLLNDTIEINENFFKNISKLVDLKTSLKNNE